MPSFGLVSEGHTDFVVIRHILAGYFNIKDPDVRKYPLRDDHNSPRGWQAVITYVGSSDFDVAFEFVQYIIIQIDTDRCEEKHYEVPRSEGERDLEPLEILEKVRGKFRDWIGEEVYERRKEKIIFAIAVDSTECWLLPLHYPDNPVMRSEWRECKNALNVALPVSSNKSDYYRRASYDLSDPATLLQAAPHNPSLKAFIDELDSRKLFAEDEA
ncbi:MAG: phage tail protein [Armatimonadetes bacterium]|nr:phage tail protein [Armatimonadota bacterium]